MDFLGDEWETTRLSRQHAGSELPMQRGRDGRSSGGSGGMPSQPREGSLEMGRAIMELGVWERQHYRFGLAGEAQADVIESYLACHSGRILYVGCGLGPYKYENLSKYGSVVAIDREEKMLRNAKEEAGEVLDVEFKVADARC